MTSLDSVPIHANSDSPTYALLVGGCDWGRCLLQAVSFQRGDPKMEHGFQKNILDLVSQ